MGGVLGRWAALPAREVLLPRMTPAHPQEQLEQFPGDWGLIERLAEHAGCPTVTTRPRAACT